MTEKLHDILERIYNQGCYAGEYSHFDDWLYEEGCDRADYITAIIREALGEQTAVKDSLITAGADAESRFLDKACEWLVNALAYSIREWSQNGETWEIVTRDTFINHFRKAMTDKTSPLFEQALADVNPDTRAEVRGNMDAVLTWHKASEELPPYDKVVIVAYDGYTEDCCFNHRSNDPEVKTSENGWCDVGYDTEPTHWMEIPEIKED